jgi:hypothetical protein
MCGGAGLTSNKLRDLDPFVDASASLIGPVCSDIVDVPEPKNLNSSLVTENPFLKMPVFHECRTAMRHRFPLAQKSSQ